MTQNINTIEINGYYIQKLDKFSLPQNIQQTLNAPSNVNVVAYSIVKKEDENNVSKVKFAYGTNKKEALNMLKSSKLLDNFTLSVLLDNIDKLD